MNRFLYPLIIYPCPNFMKFSEIYFRIEICGKIFSVTSGIYIHNIYGCYFIEMMFYRQCTISIYNTRIKSATEYCGNFLFRTSVFSFPFIICIPWGIFTNFFRIFMNCGIYVCRTCLNTSF